MERVKRWMGAAILVATAAAAAGAADNAGLMLNNAVLAAKVTQSGLGTGASAEDASAKGFEGQQALLGFGAGAGQSGAVDASGSADKKSGFATLQERHKVPGLKADTAVPSPVDFRCIGPGCGSSGGNGGEKGRHWGELIGRGAGFALGIIAFAPAVGLILSGTLTGVALGAAAIAGTWGGRPEGDSLFARIASSPLDNALAKAGGFVGEWTGRGVSKATGFVKGLFHRA